MLMMDKRTILAKAKRARIQQRRLRDKRLVGKQRQVIRSLVSGEFSNGKSEQTIADRHGLDVEIVRELVGESIEISQKKIQRHLDALKNGKQLRNPWLDPLDDANIEGYWVPSPEQIETTCNAIKLGLVYVLPDGCTSHGRKVIDVRNP